MSSREFLNMIAGLPYDSWFKASVREDMEGLVGDATIEMQKSVREKTLALLRGETKTGGQVEITTEMYDTDTQRRSTRAHQT